MNPREQEERSTVEKAKKDGLTRKEMLAEYERLTGSKPWPDQVQRMNAEYRGPDNEVQDSGSLGR